MTRTIVLAAEAAGEHAVVNELPIPPFFYGVVTFAILLLLLAVTFSFRSVGSRH